ncbi:biphenyl-2,3-diol 1,2-dioxygenase [Metarhizobium album]|uniref:Biphenyl-2,3-diol 1,2-dioxygenase n=1 Tax=Metarhizobium album TaxID=2182425 RepID=A0A2U2DHW0_9HYPH|nr:VOC family protein [Rhizobium album]PWE52903.1 biphenyl-2,3-diol 1,2-dioxygenase [Rhizobium album]
MPLNTQTIVHLRLHHLGVTTANTDAMADWYRTVLGMTIVHQTASANPGQQGAPSIKSTWMTNDEANHRIALVEIPGLEADTERSHHRRVQHFAFEYDTLGDLLGTYLRLKEGGIVPVLCTDAGLQTAFYYQDPDGNTVEINVDNFGNPLTSSEYIRTSPEFAANPMGAYVDPDKLVAAYAEGTSAWDLHTKARAGEFAPDVPYDPRVMM